MKISDMMKKIKKHPDYNKAGMVLYHNGIVRETSREGEEVTGLKVSVDHEVLNKIVQDNKKTPGIVDIQVWINEDKNLLVGDDVMFLVVAGDIRETVIKCLTDTLNLIKSNATSKTQFFKEA